MSDKLGETFDGTIASVTQFGLFVRLDEFYVEGLVHVTSLPSDYYHYEAEKHRLKGERTGTTYRLGDGLTVQVARVDMDDRKIDFGLGDEKPRPRRQPRKSRGGEEGAKANAGGSKTSNAKASNTKGSGDRPSKSEKPATRRGPRRTRNGPRKPSPNKG